MRPGCMKPLEEEIKIENASFRALGSRENSICSYKQLEIPKCHNHAMEFLCRPWSSSASDFLQIFSSNSLLLDNDTNEQDNDTLNGAEETHKSPIKQDDIKMNLTRPKSWLRGKSLTSLLRSRKEKKREEIRLHTAQLHAALSLTQLSAAIAGISSSIGKQENSPSENGVWSQDMGNILSSAVALVTTVCAESAESLGAQRAQVRAAVNSGMAIQSPIHIRSLTATAATSLRGAALLKSRALVDPLARIQERLQICAQKCIIMPSGVKECTRASIYLKRDHLIFSFRKKYFGGALESAKEYKVTNITEERIERQGNSYLCLTTKHGIIKLLFEDEMQSQIWISTILNLLEMRKPCWQASPAPCNIFKKVEN